MASINQNTAKYIPLQRWADQHFEPTPTLRTLRRWARKGHIHPQPQLVGRQYRVLETAVYMPQRQAGRMPNLTVLDSEDSVVNAIIINGSTPQPGQA